MPLRGAFAENLMGWIAGVALLIATILLLALLGAVIRGVFFSETIELEKNSWVCTKSRKQGTMVTTNMLVGKVIIPQITYHQVDVCDQYERKAP